MKTAAPAIIHTLVETFEKNLDEYRSSKNETELRREFLDKFFTALGWDVSKVVCQELCKISEGLARLAGIEIFLNLRERTTA
ncbi:MAG: hypothetical protein HZB18_05490 [Chloroflexi bacterium]|nr:hypothetical protein [Chloroflexota bacterium]